MEKIAIFAALHWECMPVVRALKQVERTRTDTFHTWRAVGAGREVWVVKTGIGIDNAAAAARAVSRQGEFSLFLSTGCAGALAPGLQPGDLVVASRIVGEASNGGLPADAECCGRLQSVAATAALRTAFGSLLCSRTLLATAATKRAAAEQHGSLAVEMEGGALAAAANAVGTPFAAVRAILDTHDTELRHGGRFIDPQSGAVKPLALAAYLAKHPGAIGDLLAMQKMMRAAQNSLQRFFAAWLATPGLI